MAHATGRAESIAAVSGGGGTISSFALARASGSLMRADPREKRGRRPLDPGWGETRQTGIF
jgi:hypothetical protein